MLTPGPKRIILIRAGRYDYAEVFLGRSTHLVGQNNAGKTSLIATLQMLYVIWGDPTQLFGAKTNLLDAENFIFSIFEQPSIGPVCN